MLHHHREFDVHKIAGVVAFTVQDHGLLTLFVLALMLKAVAFALALMDTFLLQTIPLPVSISVLTVLFYILRLAGMTMLMAVLMIAL